MIRKMILCDANQITILRIKVILSRKNWSHLIPPTSYPKYLLILALMNENCPSLEGQFIFTLEIVKKVNITRSKTGFELNENSNTCNLMLPLLLAKMVF